jgi:hypothetical protein
VKYPVVGKYQSWFTPKDAWRGSQGSCQLHQSKLRCRLIGQELKLALCAGTSQDRGGKRLKVLGHHDLIDLHKTSNAVSITQAFRVYQLSCQHLLEIFPPNDPLQSSPGNEFSVMGRRWVKPSWLAQFVHRHALAGPLRGCGIGRFSFSSD